MFGLVELTMNVFRVCLIAPSLPWHFGPYQSQMYLLGKNLASRGHAIFWHSTTIDLPVGFYFPRELPSNLSRRRTFNDSMFTYVGNVPGETSAYLRFSTMNRLATTYDFDRVVVLRDVDSVIRDEDLVVQCTMWYPSHFLKVPPVDAFTLRGFANVVTLDPHVTVPSRENITYIPHMVRLKKPSAFRFDVQNGTFVVLFQGGNYEEFDRKGWFVGMRAFAAFREHHPAAYLYIHAPTMVNIATSDAGRLMNSPRDAQPLHYYAELLGLPHGSYTIDEQVYSGATVSAMKYRADVCLHPSRAEGFGMNVLECQYAGTPVITTDFTGMGEYTLFGIAVPPVSYIFHIRGLVAEPDVRGTTLALERIYAESDKFRPVAAAAAKQWIRDSFSEVTVADKFATMLHSPSPLVSFETQIIKMDDVHTIPSVLRDSKWILLSSGVDMTTAHILAATYSVDVVVIHQNTQTVGILMKTYIVLNANIRTSRWVDVVQLALGASHVTRTEHELV
jgi:glycosyltransferase involved in cell wall biosynthesis